MSQTKKIKNQDAGEDGQIQAVSFNLQNRRRAELLNL